MTVTKIDAQAIEPDVLLAALCEWASTIDDELQRFSQLLDQAAHGTPDADDPRVKELVEALRASRGRDVLR